MNLIMILIAWGLSSTLFALMIIYISKHVKKRTMPFKAVLIIMFIGGFALYCTYHYRVLLLVLNEQAQNSSLDWVKEKNASWFYLPYVIIRSVIDVGTMFYGRSNTEVFYSLPEAKNPLAVFLFWLIHLVAFYVAATALLIRFGHDLLRWIRIMTSKISDIDLVFGINPDSLAFTRNIADSSGSMLVYVDDVVADDYETAIRDIDGLAYSDNEALRAAPLFLRRLRIKPSKTRLRLFALSSEYDRNLQYARNMSESLGKVGILPEQTELVLLGTEEWKGMNFQSSEDKYGYGSVISFDEFEMSARLLMQKYPVCNAVNFDKNGLATENTEILIVGFRKMGHEVLRQVIANGQFEGSNFHITLYDPDFEHHTGFFRSQYPTMFANYDIDFEPYSSGSNKIFRFLQENAEKLKYIVVCLDNDRDTARDAAIHMVDRLHTMGYPLNVYTCDSKSIRCYSWYANECKTYWLYDSDLLYSGELDRYAMELNHRYSKGKSVNDDWKKCSYFDRMSSRASVDYLVPLIQRIKGANGELTHEQRENLAKSEHLRWCAFHYTFGFDVMEKDEFADRLKARQDEIREHGSSSIKATKDNKAMKHVCLVDWDELAEISRIESSITGINIDYMEFDRANVDTVINILEDRR